MLRLEEKAEYRLMTSHRTATQGQRLPRMHPRTTRPVRPAMALRTCTLLVAGLTLVAALVACSSPGSTSSHKSSAGANATPVASTSAGAGASGRAATPSPTPPAPKQDVIAGLISFNGELSLTGAHTYHASFTAFPGVTSPKSSCAHIATVGTPTGKGQPRLFTIPAPPFGGNVSFTAEVEPYHGPGTYQKSSIVAAGPTVVIGTASYNLLAAGASVSVTFGANGSGELTFSNAAGGKGNPTLSGTVQWTCSVQ